MVSGLYRSVTTGNIEPAWMGRREEPCYLLSLELTWYIAAITCLPASYPMHHNLLLLFVYSLHICRKPADFQPRSDAQVSAAVQVLAGMRLVVHIWLMLI